MAGLAGGVLVCYSPAVYPAPLPESGDIPGPERQLVAAIQAAYPEGRAGQGESSLRISPLLVYPPVTGQTPQWNELPDLAAPLRVAPELALRGELAPPSVMLPTLAPGEAPLRLSQAMGLSKSPGQTPRWMAAPDYPTQLRQSRTLSMPGAATGGQPPPPGTPVIPPAPGSAIIPPSEDEIGDDIDGGFAGRPSVTPATPPTANGQGNGDQPDRGIAGLGWEIPPIRWGGSLGYSYQKSTSNSGNASTAQGMFANLGASSYIYAPWFATVSGRLGVTTSSSDSTSTGSTSGGTDGGKSGNILGGGELNMFSSSRFPFRAYFDRSDSRVTGSIVNQDYINTRLGVHQNYRSEDSMSTGNFMLDRSTVETGDGRKDSVTAFSGSYSTQTGLWQHNANARYSLGQRDGTDERVSLIGFNTAHNANFSDTANLGVTVNYSDNDIRTAGTAGSGLFSNRGRFLQVYSFGSWMPEFEDLDDLPLTVTGSLRYSSQETQFGGAATSAQSINSNLSGLYRFSNNLSASVNGALNHISVSSGESRLLTLAGTNVNYVGDSLNIGKFSYNWNVGGNANWQSGAGEVPASSQLSALASHSLSRSLMLDDGRTISLNFSQVLNASKQPLGTSQSFSNNLSLNYSMYSSDRFSGSLSGTFSDVYTTGINEQHYKNLNVGLVGQGQLSQQSSLNMNLMFNWSDQTYQTTDAFGVVQPATTQRMTLNGSANYSHLRFAGVRGLRYNVIFAADTRLRDERLFGNLGAEQDRSRMSLTNRLDYVIGLLNFRLSLVNNDAGGKKNALLFFQVTRQFGSY